MEDKNIFFSNLDETAEEVIVGIDEAGRGPVLGYMVYAALIMPRKTTKAMHFKDSKTLTSAQRNALLDATDREGFRYVYHCSYPSYISEMMLSKAMTLDEISITSVVKMLNEVRTKCSNVSMVYLDALGNCEKYKARLCKEFAYAFTITEKADSKFQVVSGASIVAKVKRDSLLSEFGNDMGSGYPSDPKTVAWLKKNINKVFGFPPGVRYSWATVKKMFGERQSKPLKGVLCGLHLDVL